MVFVGGLVMYPQFVRGAFCCDGEDDCGSFEINMGAEGERSTIVEIVEYV